jgi:hypothetical protein
MWRGLAAALALAAALGAPHARATNLSTDVTDIWWPDAEPGWGIQLIQNAGIIFATMFVYDVNNQPIFVVAALEKQPGADVWTGGLYIAEGTWFGTQWNEADRTETQIGAMTFTLTGVGTGTLVYNVADIAVTKNLSRQPLALENNTGNYRLTHTWTPTGAGCTAADAYSPAAGPVSGDLSIVNANAEQASISLTWQHAPLDICSMTASYSQVGRLGGYGGILSCPSSGKSGSLVFYEVANAVGTLTGRYVMEWSYGCTRTGRFTAISPNP